MTKRRRRSVLPAQSKGIAGREGWRFRFKLKVRNVLRLAFGTAAVRGIQPSPAGTGEERCQGRGRVAEWNRRSWVEMA